MSSFTIACLVLAGWAVGWVCGATKQLVGVRLKLQKLVRKKPLASVQRVDWEEFMRSGWRTYDP